MPARSSGLAPALSALIGKQVASSGLRLGFIGASIEARAYPHWAGSSANYQRQNGVATATVGWTLADHPMLPGHRIRIASGNRPDVEGVFEITSCTINAGTSMTVVFPDDRPNVNAGTLGAGFDIQDMHAWTVSGGWPAHLNMALDGSLDIVGVATGGTNVITDWGPERISQLAKLGPFDAVLIGSGLIGNAVKNYNGGAAPDDIYNALCRVIERVRDIIGPRVIFAETLPLSRDVDHTSAIYTGALNLIRRMWQELPRKYPTVRVVPLGEAMVSNYSAYNAAPGEDVSKGWPDQNLLSGADGVHFAYGGTLLRGATLAEAAEKHMHRWPSPEMGMLTDTNLVNAIADKGGALNKNYALGLWGNVDSGKVTLASTGVTGVAPAGTSVVFTSGRGSSTAVGALKTSPEGGAEWELAINGLGSTSGYLLTVDYAPSWLLTALNNAAVQGKEIDLFWPVLLQMQENKLLWADFRLMATVGGTTYQVAAPQANVGQFGQVSLGRAMTDGYCGVLRAPRFKLPAASYTAASLQVRIKEINGSVASGKTVLRFGSGIRFQVVN